MVPTRLNESEVQVIPVTRKVIDVRIRIVSYIDYAAV